MVYVVLPSQARVDEEPIHFACDDLVDFIFAKVDAWGQYAPSEETDIKHLTLVRVSDEF